MTPLIFIRHGETDWNVEGRFQGQRDVPLNAKGRGQAGRNGAVLARAFPDLSAYDFVASPLSRSRETMEIVRGALGFDPAAYRLDERLKEITFGDWEGFTGAELAQRFPDAHALREADKWAFLPPNGESYRRLAERVAEWLAEVARPTVAVSHGGVGRVLLSLQAGIDRQAAVSMDFPQDRILILRDNRPEWL